VHVFITGPPNGPVLFCSRASVVVCNTAGGRGRAGRACCWHCTSDQSCYVPLGRLCFLQLKYIWRTTLLALLNVTFDGWHWRMTTDNVGLNRLIPRHIHGTKLSFVNVGRQRQQCRPTMSAITRLCRQWQPAWRPVWCLLNKFISLCNTVACCVVISSCSNEHRPTACVQYSALHSNYSKVSSKNMNFK